MKFINGAKPILLLVFVTPVLISCNYILENSNYKNETISEIQTRINIHKQEAKLLLSISKNNLEILELCGDIKYVDTMNKMKQLTESLEKTHFEISKNYKKLAEDKLISIPNHINTNTEFDLESIDRDAFIEQKLKLILNKINTQIQLLETLGKTTNNVEFKVVAINGSKKLKSNINRIESALNRLNQKARNI